MEKGRDGKKGRVRGWRVGGGVACTDEVHISKEHIGVKQVK